MGLFSVRRQSAIALPVFAFFSFIHLALAQENTATLEQPAEPRKALFGFDAEFSNVVGTGTFLPGYARKPYFATTLRAEPTFNVPLPKSWPRLKLSAFGTLSMNWLNSYSTSVAESNHPFSYTDLTLRISMPKALDWKSAGLSIGARVDTTFGISPTSRFANRMLGVGAASLLAFEGGGFLVTFKPAAMGYVYSNVQSFVDCGQVGLPASVNANDPGFVLSDYVWPQSGGHPRDRVGDQCKIPGRQTLGKITFPLEVGWTIGAHTLSAAANWQMSFLRGLTPRDDLRSIYSSDANITESSSGEIRYAYEVPVDLDLVLSTGVYSLQAAFSKHGGLNFPFADFFTPGKNQTQLFVDVSVGI